MKNLKIVILFILLCISTLVAAGQQTYSASKSTKLSIKKTSVSHRPKAPSRQIISCSYENDIFTFDFVISE